MADKDKATADDKPAKKAKEDPAPALAAPDIHFLQAQRATLVSNRALLDPPATPEKDAELKEIDRQIAEIDKQLA
jgi:hypothetical protein